MSTIVFVRHGRTEWNDQSRIQGRQPIPLTPKGRSDVESLIPIVLLWRPCLVFTSPVARAVESASILSMPLGQTPMEVAEFSEWDVGAWTGRTDEELAHSSPEWATYLRDPSYVAPPGGESIRNLSGRVV